MSRLLRTSPAHRFGPFPALPALGALALIITAAAPASAGEGLGRGQFPSFKVGQALQPRVGHHPGKTSGAGLERRDPRGSGKRVGKTRKPHLPPIITSPPEPPAGGE